jgi:[protein-PII] uridylyltransferase
MGAAGPEKPVEIRTDRVDVRVEALTGGSRVTVVAVDRVGLLAATAAAVAVLRVSVREARAWSQGKHGVSVWEVDDAHLDVAVLRERLESILEGRYDPTPKLARVSAGRLGPSVEVRPEASAEATVLEVRMDDRQGVVHLVCAALAGLELTVRSAHVNTFGPQAVDVFYVQEYGAGALTDERSADAAHAVRRALSDPVTLDGVPDRA